MSEVVELNIPNLQTEILRRLRQSHDASLKGEHVRDFLYCKFDPRRKEGVQSAWWDGEQHKEESYKKRLGEAVKLLHGTGMVMLTSRGVDIYMVNLQQV